VHRATGRAIGSCGLRAAGLPERCAELGLELVPGCRGQGYGVEAARLMLRFGFDALGLEEVRGVSAADNDAAAMLGRRLGFVAVAPGDVPSRAGDPARPREAPLTTWRLTRDAWARPVG
jgi:RimJ/RimL family protein N-acetyltransferase